MTFLPTKYRSKRTQYNGVWYDSKAEANHAKQLDILKKAADRSERVVKIERQRQAEYVLPGGISYRADFRVTYADGHIEIHEVKGFETPAWKMKQKLMKEAYPEIKIKVIK